MLTINLLAIQQNWKYIHSVCGVNVAAVIKANAYGLGAFEVGRALAQIGCSNFFVASLEEGVSARKFLPHDVTIYVLGGIRAGEECYFVEFDLIPVLCSMSDLERWAQSNVKTGEASPSAIKVNTGMTRLGLDIPELVNLCNQPSLIEACNPILLMSHLACAEDETHPLNAIQLENFRKISEIFRARAKGACLSLANSSGVFLGADWHFDLVRPGAALYGVSPQPNRPNPFVPVVSLRLPIVQVRRLYQEAAIGYGAEVVLPKGGRVVVVAGGYADGINRTLGRHPEGVLCGYSVKAVGRTSMDLTMFDVSNIPLPDDVLLNSSVEVLNENLSVDYLSKKNGSLGYEVLTSLGARYKREYIGDANG